MPLAGWLAGSLLLLMLPLPALLLLMLLLLLAAAYAAGWLAGFLLLLPPLPMLLLLMLLLMLLQRFPSLLLPLPPRHALHHGVAAVQAAATAADSTAHAT